MSLLIIKKLELQGFKSFPERTKILFHPGINAIVGPNGTGKSNIVDAVLWVMGGSRPKSLRGDRVEDIIFNGNQKQPPLGMADVEMVLANEEEEITISHRVFRSGESEYRLDGKSVRLKDIQETLWKKAVAEREYFVIEQGAIGSLVTSKPADKRLLLEEAAGTAYYKDKKKQAQNKLDDSELNLTRLEDIISEVERAKNSLQRQAQAATRFRKLRERIRELTALHFQRRYRQTRVSREDIISRYGLCQDKEREVVSRIKSEDGVLAFRRKELWDLEQALKTGQETLFSTKTQLARAETDIEKETKRIEFFEEKRKRAGSEIEELERELAGLGEEAGNTEKQEHELNEAMAIREREIAETEKENAALRKELFSKAESIKSLKDSYFVFFAELTERRNEKVRLDKELELLVRQEEKLLSRASSEEDALHEKNSRLSRLQEEIDESSRFRREREEALGELERKLGERASSLEELQGRSARLAETRDQDILHLQALKKIRQSEQGEPAGEESPAGLGYLADLIEAEPEVARLADICWEAEAKSRLITAGDFIENFSGKSPQGDFFILSESPQHPFPEELRASPDVLGFLKSRLVYDASLAAHIASLPEAILVPSLEQAVRLWLRFPAFNYLTSRGEVLFSGGLLRPGKKTEGLFALSGEMRRLEEKIVSTETELAPLLAALEEAFAEKRRLEESIREESEQASQAARRIETLSKEREFEAAEAEKIKTTLLLLQKEYDSLHAENTERAQKMEILGLRIAGLEDEEKSLKAQQEIEEKALASSKEKEDERGRRFIELKSERDLTGEKLRGLSHHRQGLVQRRNSLLSKVASLRQEIQKSEEEQDALKRHILSLEEKREILSGDQSQAEARLVELELTIQKAKSDADGLEKKISLSREEEQTVKEERVKWEISKAELERDLVNLEENCWQELKKTLTEVQSETVDEALADEEIEERLSLARDNLQKYKTVNLLAEEEYLAQKERFDFLMQQKKDLRESIDSTQEAIRKIDEESKMMFLTALAEVNKSFQEIFALLFKGGSAEIKLIDPANPLESGVEIVAQPPGKRVQSLTLLSGGEKSLTSLSFLFALFRYRPTPFCFLDEVDAALDDVNLARFLELMKNIKSQTQFVIITHNYKTMEVADYIYGTTMAEPNVTKLYSMKFEKKTESPAP